MRQLIRQREIVADDWRYLDELSVDGRAGAGATRTRALILPLGKWQAERDQWWLWAGRLGVRIAPADRVESLEPDLQRLALVAIEFTGPSEGRGYSQARVLRDRFGFAGEIRAVGYVKRDQLFFLSRCGFDAFELSAGVDLQEARAAFDDFTVAYQPGAERFSALRRRAG